MEKTGVSWSAKKSRGKVSLLKMMGKEESMGDERYCKRGNGTFSTVMGLRLFLHMEWRFLVFESER
jgi:hypothetical protein